MAALPQLPRSKYNSVRALLVQWEDDDLGVDKEVGKLAAVLSNPQPDGYNFSVERWYIPSSSEEYGPEDLLDERLREFRKGAKEDDLLILYYGGHGGGSPHRLYWAANKKKDAPSLIWHNVQGLLLGCRADVLLILDSCYASLAASNTGQGQNWMLGATTKESVATGVAWNSFTSTLTRELKRGTFRYWAKGEELSVQSLHTSFLSYERDLDFTPVLARLTDYDCLPTDLTPLPDPRPALSKANTEPVSMPSAQPSNDTLPFIPKLAGKSKISSNLTADEISSPAISPHLTANYQALSEERVYHGLTSIHDTTNGPDDERAFDIVLVHGFQGHATESFSYLDSATREKKLWPREVLVRELAWPSISSRILTYPWNPSNLIDEERRISDMYSDLAQEIQRVRVGCPTRPMVFIGCGFGGLLIKQLVRESINLGMLSDPDFDSPIRACFFLGLARSNKSSNYTNGLHLATIKAVARTDPLSDGLLDSQRNLISNALAEFDEISEQWEIKCASFGRSESAPFGLHYSHPIKKDYQNGGQLQDGYDVELVTGTICNTLAKTLGLRPPGFADRPPNRERVYGQLKAYDTRFLVDDSDSMAGRKWARTKKLMAKIASIAVQHDSNGVDVQFFNNYVEKKKRCNLDNIEDVMRLFTDLLPYGETPTADKLDEELNEYCHEYERDRSIKGLNLIVLTDGAPSTGQDVEGVLVKYARRLERADAPLLKVGVQFVQIGVDEGASKFLQKLDDNIKAIHGLDRDVRGSPLSHCSRADRLADG